MIKDDMTPFKFRIKFFDNEVERTQYADNLKYHEDLVSRHGHLSGLQAEPLTLTAEQQSRLTEISGAGLSGHDASVYVEFGTTEDEESQYFNAELFDAYQRAKAEPAVRAQRKRAESAGVMLNGVRYAGDSANRQALSEAILAAEDTGSDSFSTWKDSAGNYRNAQPLAEVKSALRKIRARRSVLIALEALYVSQVASEQLDVHGLDWTTEHD